MVKSVLCPLSFPFSQTVYFLTFCSSCLYPKLQIFHDTPNHSESNNSVTSTANTTPTSNTFVVLLYLRNILEKLSRVLRNNGLKVGYNPMNVLRARFPRPKDKPSAAQTRGILYKNFCSDCHFVYYRQTDRALYTRIKEHKRAVHVCDSNSKVAQNAKKFNHNTDFWLLEAWHSLRDRKAGNEHRHSQHLKNRLCDIESFTPAANIHFFNTTRASMKHLHMHNKPCITITSSWLFQNRGKLKILGQNIFKKSLKHIVQFLFSQWHKKMFWLWAFFFILTILWIFYTHNIRC